MDTFSVDGGRSHSAGHIMHFISDRVTFLWGRLTGTKAGSVRKYSLVTRRGRRFWTNKPNHFLL